MKTMDENTKNSNVFGGYGRIAISEDIADRSGKLRNIMNTVFYTVEKTVIMNEEIFRTFGKVIIFSRKEFLF